MAIIDNLVFLTAGLITGVFTRRALHFLRKKNKKTKNKSWSIGIYTGYSPFSLFPPSQVKNPVLTARDVSDAEALFVADPFMILEDNTWHMFFEVMNARTKKGDIGLAVSNDGFAWTYKQIVLNEPFHMSYPYVFKFRDEYYMIPETESMNSVRLYRAVDFPVTWVFEEKLLLGYHFVDASIAYFDETWWMFTSNNECDNLYLHYAAELKGPWEMHPKSPVMTGNPHMARPAGRVIVLDNKMYRFAQDDRPYYGREIRAFEITKINKSDYEEIKVTGTPILGATGSGWNGKGMHHSDPHHLGDGRWIACVDGKESAGSPQKKQGELSS